MPYVQLNRYKTIERTSEGSCFENAPPFSENILIQGPVILAIVSQPLKRRLHRFHFMFLLLDATQL